MTRPLLALLTLLPALCFAQAAAPSNTPSALMSAYTMSLFAPQGAAGAKCLTEGGAATSGVCLGGYPGAYAGLYLGITPANRTDTNYTLLSNGTDAFLNTGAATGTIYFRNANATRWSINGSGHLAAAANGYQLDLGGGADDYLYSDGTDIRTPSILSATAMRADVLYSNSSTGAQRLASGISAANATATVPASLIKPQVALDADDLILDVQNSAGATRLKVDTEGDVAAAGTVAAAGGVKVGAGTLLSKILIVSAAVDPPSLAAQTVARIAVAAPADTVPAGSLCTAHAPATLEADLVAGQCWVTAADAIALAVHSVAAVDGAALTWRFTITTVP